MCKLVPKPASGEAILEHLLPHRTLRVAAEAAAVVQPNRVLYTLRGRRPGVRGEAELHGSRQRGHQADGVATRTGCHRTGYSVGAGTGTTAPGSGCVAGAVALPRETERETEMPARVCEVARATPWRRRPVDERASAGGTTATAICARFGYRAIDRQRRMDWRVVSTATGAFSVPHKNDVRPVGSKRPKRRDPTGPWVSAGHTNSHGHDPVLSVGPREEEQNSHCHDLSLVYPLIR